jgi:halimadienyl-diphosphate synthase
VTGPVDVTGAARAVLTQLQGRPWGTVSASVYETARLVALAPWLPGHLRRVEFLLTEQRPDGAWGGPESYALVPTLSATDALLAEVGTAAGDPRVMAAARRGLLTLRHRLHSAAPALPDLAAADLIVPGLIASINARLRRFPDLGRLPAHRDAGPIAAIRAHLRAGQALPQKVLHALEIAGPAAEAAAGVRPHPLGPIGASPAATAVWLGRGGQDRAARAYLDSVIGLHNGPVPCALPVTEFERAWVLCGLLRAGVQIAVPRGLAAGLGAPTPAGIPGGAGLPADADTTAVTLYARRLLGDRPDLSSLDRFETPTHFCTWPGEDGVSTSVNSHALDALAAGADARRGRYRGTIAKVTGWLRERQHPDGSWTDRWHASPYYATMSAALALRHADPVGTGPAVAAATEWVLATQRVDGSWGRWGDTAEETAYALHILLAGDHVGGGADDDSANEAVTDATARGLSYLVETLGQRTHPRLWHDKDLYVPYAIVDAAVLGAIHLAQRNPAVRAHRRHRVQQASLA